MLCKFCNAEIEADRLYCPVCGKRQDIDTQTKTEQNEPNNQKNKITLWKLILAAVVVVALVCTLVFLLLKDSQNDPGAGASTSGATETTASESDSTIIQEPVSEYTDNVGIEIAKWNDDVLTSDLLQMYYTVTINSFLESYSTILSSIGLDLTKPFDEQAYPNEGAETWEDFFRDLAIEQWESRVAVCALAKEENFVLGEEWTSVVDVQIESLENMAKENNYASAAAMVKMSYGDCCTVETYQEYLRLEAIYNAYLLSLYEVTDEQIEASFMKNEQMLAEDGITKTSALVSSVRHILIAPEGGTTDENGKKTYSDAEWEACEKEAQSVYEEWKSGEASEKSFIDMVSQYTDDAASISTGGLYENVANDGSYVEAFQNWAIDVARKEGDTGLVKSPFGYHIMYYVEGEPEWIAYSRMFAQQENLAQAQDKTDKMLADNPPEILQEQIVVQNVYAR